MRQLLLISFLSSSFHYGFSQLTASEVQPRYDSLHHALSVVKEDTNKVKIWIELANYHKYRRLDSGIYYATKALSLSRPIGYVSQETRALNYLALSYSALDNYTAAIRIHLEALRIAERRGNAMDVALSCLGLGGAYFNFGNFRTSAEFYKRANSLFKSNHDNYFTAISTTYLSRSFFALGQLDSAFLYIYKSKQIAEAIPNTYAELANLHNGSGSIDSALYYFRKSYKLTVTSSGRSYRGLYLAKLFRTIGQMDSCLFYANDALKKAQNDKLYPAIRDVSLFFAELYEKENPSKALQFSKQALASSDSLTKMSNMSAFTDFIDYDEQQRQYELATAEKEYQSSIRTNTLLGSSFTLLVIAFLLYRNNKQKQKANALLQEQKEEVQSMLEKLESTQSQLIQSEKMASLGELTAGIAHEIQNPLNFVNNFSDVSNELLDEMKSEFKKGDTEQGFVIADDIKQNLEKILHHGKRADAIVKGMLQHSRSSSGVKEPTDINVLADEYLRLAYHGFRAKDKSFNAKFITDFDPTIETINVVPQEIGRVILNLINNAFYAVTEKQKHGTDGYEPSVMVSTKNSGTSILISVKDNGNGIPDSIKEKIFQPFFTTKPTGQGTGLGLSLSYDIVKASGGEIKVSTKESEGTEFTISLPA